MMNSRTVLRLAVLIGCAVLVAAPAARAQRKLQPTQVSQLRTIAIDGSEAKLVYETSDLIEAPNWTPDGKWLVYNSSGGLWRIASDGSGAPQRIPTGAIRTANNDHVLSPDGKTIYISASGHLYAVPFEGGEPRRISNDHAPERQFRYFLHGISPDGVTLAYVGAEKVGEDVWGRLDLFTIPAKGGPDVRLTDTPAPDDGPEYSPDGKWIYFNSELDAKTAGHAQIFRMRPDGTGLEQLTRDDRVNWFPHVAPAGKWIAYMSYPPGTTKHPADKHVILRRMRLDGSEQADVIALFGGQGTFNVNSWAPDSRRFAYVAYPIGSGITATPTSSSLKPLCAGLMIREFRGTRVHDFIDSVVVNVRWADLETRDQSFDGPGWGRIEASRKQGVKIRLRIMAGVHAPAFAKKLGGPGISDSEHGIDCSQTGGIAVWNRHDSTGGVIPRFWQSEALDQYEQLMAEVARRYDEAPEICEVVASGCMTVYAEPFYRVHGDPGGNQRLFEAGLTFEKDRAAHRRVIEIHHRLFKRTRTSLAINAWDVIDDSPKHHRATFEPTAEFALWARSVMGEKLVLQNNGTGRDAGLGARGLDSQHFAFLSAVKGPKGFQTRTLGRLGGDAIGLGQTIENALRMGANFVELPAGFEKVADAATLRAYDQRLEGASVK